MRDFRIQSFSRAAWTFIVLLAILFSSMPVQAHARSNDTPLAFSDGKWTAKFSIHAHVPTEVSKLDVSYLGDMGFNSSGGMLEGEWLMTGQANYTGDISGTAQIDAGGKVSGSSADPSVSTKNFIINMDITVSGVNAKTQVDLGSEGGLGMILTNATCSMVTADIVAPAMANYQSAGINAKVSGAFTAIRIGDLAAASETDYMNEVADLIDAAEALKQDAVNGNGVDFESLNTLVTKAENLNLGLKKNIACGFGGKKTYLTIITDIVSDLANFALDNPQLFTTAELSRLASAALSVGAMGSGAANPQQAAQLKAKFINEFGDRLNDAQAGKSCSEAIQIQVSAAALGDANLKSQAKNVVDAVC